MANILCKKNGSYIHIIISGNATIGFAPKARDFMQTIINGEYTECHIDITRISEIDISFLQLLASFRISMINVNKKIVFESIPNNHPFIKFILQVGIRKEYFFRECSSYAV